MATPLGLRKKRGKELGGLGASAVFGNSRQGADGEVGKRSTLINAEKISKSWGGGGEQNWLVLLSVRGSQTQKWLLVQLQQRFDSNSRLVTF